MTTGYVYILASGMNGTLYIGVTSNLKRRISEHKEKRNDGFTKRYAGNNLVYYEMHRSMRDAIAREKQLKKWEREWKLDLIEQGNPDWKDLFEELL